MSSMPSPGTFSSSLHFLESGLFTDFTIKCNGYEWEVHKVIIAAECGFFRKLVTSNFKVNLVRSHIFMVDELTDWESQEALEDKVDFPEEDPKLIARLILFLYTNYYPLWQNPYHEGDEQKANAKWFKALRSLLAPSDDPFLLPVEAKGFPDSYGDSLAIDAAMHNLADKYDIPKLAVEARRNYMQARKRLICWYPVFEVFAESVKIVYQTTTPTDRRLRDIALLVGQDTLEDMRVIREFEEEAEDGPLMKELLMGTPEFALELLTIDLKIVRVVCDDCETPYFVSDICDCGGRGICGKKKCTDDPWKGMRCNFCQKVGGCRRPKLERLEG
jgi:BTB/POZ domain